MDILFSELADLDNIVDQIVRPTRQRYTLRDLQPQQRQLEQQNGGQHHQEFVVENRMKLQIKGSIWESTQTRTDNICIYLHGNAGSRMEANSLVKHLLPNGFSLCSFDFSGCGLSQGEFITLGLKEVYDLESVVNFLVQKTKYKKIYLIGRSMGAVTAVLYQSKIQHPNIKGLILDSPFSSFKKLSYQQAYEKAIGFQSYFVENALELIQQKIIKKTGYDLFTIDLAQVIGNIQQPILFIYSYVDNLIPFTHSQELISIYENQNGQAQSYCIEQNHNDFRSDEYFQKIVSFIKNNHSQAQSKQQFYQSTPYQYLPVTQNKKHNFSQQLQQQQLATNQSLNFSQQNVFFGIPPVQNNQIQTPQPQMVNGSPQNQPQVIQNGQFQSKQINTNSNVFVTPNYEKAQLSKRLSSRNNQNSNRTYLPPHIQQQPNQFQLNTQNKTYQQPFQVIQR